MRYDLKCSSLRVNVTIGNLKPVIKNLDSLISSSTNVNVDCIRISVVVLSLKNDDCF